MSISTKNKPSIEWGKGSAFNFARVGEIRVERSKYPDGWGYMLSNDHHTYLRVDNRRFNSMDEMNEAILEHVYRIRPM